MRVNEMPAAIQSIMDPQGDVEFTVAGMIAAGQRVKLPISTISGWSLTDKRGQGTKPITPDRTASSEG
jgi:hypothetical protein